MSKRSEKIVELSKFTNLETGEFNDGAFEDMELLYRKGRKYHRLCQRLRTCDRCDGLNMKRVSEVVCGWGDLNADVFFVGQSGHEPGMYSQLPFILGSGLLIDAALRLSGLNRRDCFFSNAVHCHPERNRASSEEEKENCLPYLFEELDIIQPNVVIALGKDAEQSVDRYMSERECSWKYLHYVHPASLIYGSPESRPNYITKMSLDIDKVLEKEK